MVTLQLITTPNPRYSTGLKPALPVTLLATAMLAAMMKPSKTLAIPSFCSLPKFLNIVQSPLLPLKPRLLFRAGFDFQAVNKPDRHQSNHARSHHPQAGGGFIAGFLDQQGDE